MPDLNDNPERFDPADSSGTLMDAEHRCRYWWAAQAAEGKEVLDAACGTGYGSLILAEGGATGVTGIDLSDEAVRAASERLGGRGSVVQGDLRELPFEDDSFDLIVCFETIEHVAEGAKVLAEFRRVLRPAGVLLISSPNPGVYPEGNEHHVHEYSPAELADLVGEAFPRAVEHSQHPWIASAIRPIDAARKMEEVAPRVRALTEVEPGEQTYTILVAGGTEAPDLGAIVALGEAFEVSWWADQLDGAQEQLDRMKAELDRAEAEQAEAQAHAAGMERHLTRELTATVDRERAAGVRLNEANGRVLQASEEIGRLRAQDRHYHELKTRNEDLGIHYDVAVTRLREIESSKAWRLVEALRRLRARL